MKTAAADLPHHVLAVIFARTEPVNAPRCLFISSCPKDAS